MDNIGLKEIGAVFVGGGLGASARVWLSAWFDARWSGLLPQIGVLSVNLLGCFAIGFGAVWLAHPVWRLAVLGGVLGGFTTYSAFALLSLEHAQAGRHGVVLAQILVHLIGGVLAVWGGMSLAKALGLGPTS